MAASSLPPSPLVPPVCWEKKKMRLAADALLPPPLRYRCSLSRGAVGVLVGLRWDTSPGSSRRGIDAAVNWVGGVDPCVGVHELPKRGTRQDNTTPHDVVTWPR